MRRLIAFCVGLMLLMNLSGQSAESITRLGYGMIHAVAWHPEGETLAIGSSQGVQLYDPSLTLIDSFGDFAVMEVIWSPDGTQLAVLTPNATFIYADSEMIHSLEAGCAAVWSPDGSAIAIVTETDFQRVTLSTSETVYRGEGQLAGVDWESAWILHDGQTITWEGSAGEARSPRPAFCDHPALSPDRSQWFDPVNMQIREVESGAMIATLPFMAELFTTQTGAWSADAQQFAVITANTEALIFSTADWTLIDRIDWRPSGNRDAIAFGRWHPEQDQLLIAAADGLRLYQQDTLIQRVETYFDLALSVAWSHDRIVTGHADGLVRVWDADTGAHLRTCEGHTSQVIKVIFINPNQILSFAGAFDQDDGRMIIWDATTCTIHETSPYVGAIPLTMIFTDNGIIGSAFSNTVRWRADGLDLISTQGFFDLARFGDQVIGVTGDSGQVMILPDQVWVDGLPTLFAIAVHPDQTVIAVGGQDGTIRLLDVESREIIRTITEHQSAIMALQWHGDRLASVSIDGDLYLHDLGHETAIELNTSERIAHELAWSADGRRLIVVGTQLIVLELTDEIP